MNTMTKIVIAAVAVLIAARMSANGKPEPKPNPESATSAHSVRVLSVACDPNHGTPRADVAVMNTGTTTIEYAKAVVSFGGQLHDSYLSHDPIRPGSTVVGDVYANKGDSASCSLVSIQDGDGYAVRLSR